MTPPRPREVIGRLRDELGHAGFRTRNAVQYVASDLTVPHPTPKDTVWSQSGIQLWRYRSDRVTVGPPVVLFIGLVSRSAIFDLHEQVSLARTLRDEGFDVYLLDWGIPGDGDGERTLETYLLRILPRALRAVLETSRADAVTLLGYCMGGNLALVALAAQPELPVNGLITMATGIDFDALPPQLAPLRDGSRSVESFIDPETGCVPPSLVNGTFRIRKPTAGIVQVADLLERLGDPAFLAGHQAISRWTGDHIPLPGGVARQMVGNWLQENAFLCNRLVLDGKRLDLKDVRVPTLAILTRRDEVIPPAAARPILDVIGSGDGELLELDAGHIGLVIGRSAYKTSYPAIVRWLRRHGETIGD